MRIDNEVKLDFSDVLIRPKRSTLTSRRDVVLERTFTFLHSPKKWSGIPIITANMATSGTLEMAKTLSKHKIITALHKFYSADELEVFFKSYNSPDYIAYSLGIRDEDFDKLKIMKERGLLDKFSFICLDVPNAYLERFTGKVKELRSICPEHIIIAGNVVTNEITEQILLEGADIVKIGIGSGSACTTRRQTGVGYPQLSAVIECADAAHGISKNNGSGRIMSDGGIISPSCIAKAFCGGADFVMIGSMFAGFDQSGGALIERSGLKFKEHFGMSSATAMNKYYGKVDEHRASEGRTVEVPYKGDVANFVHEILGSLRSTGTYIGARNLREFSKRTTFLMVNRQLSTFLEPFDTNKN
ncbi:MAG: GMP reductase [Candidatus Woesearchaeota archaeon]